MRPTTIVVKGATGPGETTLTGARVSAKQLLEASLRLRPDRFLLAELRSEEAYYYLGDACCAVRAAFTEASEARPHASSTAVSFVVDTRIGALRAVPE